MAEFMVVTWSVAQNCMQQHEKSVKRIMDYWHKNAERFKLRSLRYYSQIPGGDSSTYRRVMVYEYDSLVDLECFNKEMEKDKKAKGLKNQLFANIDMKTRRAVRWRDKQRNSWFESR